MGVTEKAVSGWMQRARHGRVQALKPRPCSGRPRKLATQQRAQIPELLAPGARAYGFADETWTTRRIAQVLQRHFGVAYHSGHLSRGLREIGRTPQKVVRILQHLLRLIAGKCW